MHGRNDLQAGLRESSEAHRHFTSYEVSKVWESYFQFDDEGVENIGTARDTRDKVLAAGRDRRIQF